MNIEVQVHSSKNINIERYSFIAIVDENEFLIKLSKRKYGPLFKVNETNNLKELILECYKQLKSQKYSPNEIEEQQKLKYLDKYFFLLISIKIFNKHFNSYIINLIKNHIKLNNCDFKNFFVNNIGLAWFNESILKKEKVYIRKKIKEIFEVTLLSQTCMIDTYITKNLKHTSHKHYWDIKYKKKLYTEILFNIPNNDVKNIIYCRISFLALLETIEVSFNQERNIKQLFDNKKIVAFIIVLIILFFKEKFETLVDLVIKKLIHSYQIINIKNVKKELFDSYKIKTINYILSYHREGNTLNKNHYFNSLYKQFAQILISKVEKGYINQKSQIDYLNRKQIESNYLKLQYFNVKEGNLSISIVDLTPYKEFKILYEIREYVNWLIFSKKKTVGRLLHIKQFFIDFILENYQLKDFSSFDIDKEMAQNFSLYLMSNQNISKGKNLTISTRKEIITDVRGFFTFTVKHEISKKHRLKQLTINPFSGITLSKTEKHKKHYEPLPEEVYWQIMEHINELSDEIKNAFIILSATGFRWSEIIGLEKDCLYIKNGQIYVKSIEHKNKISNLKKGKDIYRRIPLFDELAIQAIKNQIKISNKQNIDSSLIFHKRNKNFYSSNYILISNDYYNGNINKLIKKYNVKSENNQLWHYSSHQMRVRIATLMAENGFESEEIANFLNHSNTDTINNAYAFVRKKRMAELNTNFFKEHFNSIIPSKNLNNLTKEERENLYVHLSLDYRQMEYGKCIIPISKGDCGKLQESSSCASCEYLITSKDYLPKWESFLANQKNRIKELEDFFSINNLFHDEYKSYVEYQRELSYLEKYQDIIDNLRNS